MNRNDAVVDDDMLLQLFSTGGDTQTKIPHHFPEISQCVQVAAKTLLSLFFLKGLPPNQIESFWEFRLPQLALPHEGDLHNHVGIIGLDTDFGSFSGPA